MFNIFQKYLEKQDHSIIFNKYIIYKKLYKFIEINWITSFIFIVKTLWKFLGYNNKLIQTKLINIYKNHLIHKMAMHYTIAVWLVHVCFCFLSRFCFLNNNYIEFVDSLFSFNRGSHYLFNVIISAHIVTFQTR